MPTGQPIPLSKCPRPCPTCKRNCLCVAPAEYGQCIACETAAQEVERGLRRPRLIQQQLETAAGWDLEVLAQIVGVTRGSMSIYPGALLETDSELRERAIAVLESGE